MAAEIYLLEVSVCVLIFYVLYLALFKRTTFFIVNRFYLLSGLVLSFAIPLLTIPKNKVAQPLLSAGFLSGPLDLSDHAYGDAGAILSETATIPYFLIVQAVYSIGLAFMAVRFVRSLHRMHTVKKHAKRLEDDAFQIYETRMLRPFTFLQMIFLPSRKINRYVLEHEKVHARQWHTIDVLLAEIVIALLWFNPFAYWYKKAIQQQHEYLADACTLRMGANIAQYLRLMLHQLTTENYGATISQFYSTSIKNRITMITKKRSTLARAGVYLAALPVCALLLFAFADRDPKGDTQALSEGTETVIIIDPGHGGTDVGAHHALGLTEKALTLALAKHIQAAASEKGVKVVLTRSGDETLALQERTALAGKVSAKLFISLHINNNDADASMDGIECTVSENNVHARASKEFANVLLNQLQTISGIAVNGVKASDFYVLKNNSIPAIAVELGFLSNTADYAFISNDRNQKDLAEKIVAAATHYLK
ncbi:MAG TPA: M56/M15 family metallopeptidase [Ohtaekwangia sp.]|nr:M56/M15 family metallopeptidase [Ohtaekwangia sp.]